MIAPRLTIGVSALVTASWLLAGCADPVRPGMLGRFGLEILGPDGATAPGTPTTPVQASPDPVSPPAPGGGAASPAAPARGGGGKGGSAPVVIDGQVFDESGTPVVGAVVRGESFEAVIGADGLFRAPTSGEALTVEAPGFATQTAGPPYRFRLESELPPAHGTAFTLTGVTDPPLAQAVVTYADAAGTVASTRTEADGSFSLTVEPVGSNTAAGAIAVYENLSLAGRERGVLQAAPAARLGAASLPTPDQAGPLHLSVAPAAGTATLAAGVPAGLRAEEAVLSLTSDLGVHLPLVGADGTWPSSVPVFAASGFKYGVALSAIPPDERGRTVAERVGLRSGERWAPTLLELPEAEEAPKPGKKLKWKRKGAKAGMALFAPGRGKPAWESTADTALPELAPGQAGFEIELQTWDAAQGPRQVAAGDRRYAVRRVPVEAPPEPPVEEEAIATP